MGRDLKKIKVQITLPEPIVSEIEEECKKTYLTKSAWFLKIVEIELAKKKGKKVIELDI